MKYQILNCLKGITYVLLPATAWATGISITLGETMTDIPLLAWLMVLILSGLSGLAALLNRIKADLPANLVLFVCSHMAGSLLAGVLTFFAAEAADVADMAEPIGIALAAYGGAALMDKWAAKFADKVTS